MSDKLQPAQGNWVSGDKFWNRTNEIEQFIRKIREGANILLIAQRRMGKTSLIREIASRFKEDFHCLYIDIEKTETPEEFIVQLGLATHPYESVWDKTKKVFSTIPTFLEGISVNDFAIHLRPTITAGDWKLKGDQLFGLLAETDKRVLLLLDEVPIFVQNLLSTKGKQETDRFLK